METKARVVIMESKGCKDSKERKYSKDSKDCKHKKITMGANISWRARIAMIAKRVNITKINDLFFLVPAKNSLFVFDSKKP